MNSILGNNLEGTRILQLPYYDSIYTRHKQLAQSVWRSSDYFFDCSLHKSILSLFHVFHRMYAFGLDQERGYMVFDTTELLCSNDRWRVCVIFLGIRCVCMRDIESSSGVWDHFSWIYFSCPSTQRSSSVTSRGFPANSSILLSRDVMAAWAILVWWYSRWPWKLP